MFKRLSKTPPASMPERRRSTFRAPGAIDTALLAEGATTDGTVPDPATAAEGEVRSTASDPVETSTAPRRRRGFRAAAEAAERDPAAGSRTEAAPESSASVGSEPDAAPSPVSGAAAISEQAAAAISEPAGAQEHQPRHRADHVRNRRPSSGAARRLMALSCSTAILGVSAFGAVAAWTDTPGGASLLAEESVAAESSVAAGAADEIVSTPVVAEEDGPTVTSGLSTASVPFTGGQQITVTGEELDQVGAVSVAGVPATIVAADESAVTFAVPATTADALGGAEVQFSDVSGEPVPVEETVASIAAAGVELKATTVAPTEQLDALTLTYTSNRAIDAQLGYVLTYWSSYNSAEYTVLSGVDCANFTSQSLIARGWAMDAGWYYDRATGAMSPSWSSSTAMRDWLTSRPDLATPLDDSHRGLVKVGDIAQFDWDGSGDRDHTAVVTRVEHSANGTAVWVGGHTKDADYWNVDEALASGGGSVSYFSLE